MEKIYRVQMNKHGMPNFSTAEEVEPCKDAISREWLLNELEEMNVANFYEANFHSNEMYGQMKRMIKAAPSVTVEPKHGEWIDAEIPLESGGSMPIQVCNLCKTFYPLAYTGGGHRFCPHCGAKMLAKDTNVPNKEGVDNEHDK